MINKISDLALIVRGHDKKKKLVLAAGEDQYALKALSEAEKKEYIDPIVVGDRSVIESLCDEFEIPFDHLSIVHETDQIKAIEQAVKMVSSFEGDVLMKGASSTAILLKAVLNKEWGLRQGKLLSHLAVFELKNYYKLLSVTDVAINIAPNVIDKIEIIKNAAGYLSRLGFSNLQIALIAAVEKVYESMPATIEASEVVEKIKKDKLIPNCVVDGPFALDNAIDQESALHKGIKSSVAGRADLLVMPQIETGNVFYKALAILAEARIAAVVLGAKAPIVLTSRSDSEETKLNSILLAAAVGK